jgi:predicted nucleic acid-binding protein
MTFSGLAAGDSVFLDANTLLYHFTADLKHGVPRTDLLERIERQELSGFTSTHVLGEVAHRLMTIEASLVYSRPFAGIAYWLKKHPAEVQHLTHFRQAIQEVPRYRIQVLVTSANLLDQAAAVTQHTGVLHNDAMIVAIMRMRGLSKLASADQDFDRIPGLTRYAPV